ncbi:hypothetical protein FE394_13280 [Xenorhabdus sp. Reich]|uniref:Uncharacterized protein n=1 Tax=Xenorhabdus littoralis TaxID=2582835 RepID=A0ABU4SNC6_9GAMM|nr:hypothetical protein [Xenorhabdus sp. Reich]MDX8000150.1 hypothetical protein [Xenorhabdus sp. Reich]
MNISENITLSPPTLPQADGNNTISISDLRAMEIQYLLMAVPSYHDVQTGDSIVGQLCLNGDCSSGNQTGVLKSIPYTITPDKTHESPYYLLFVLNDISQYGSYQAQYTITSYGNTRSSPAVNINLISKNSSSLSDYIPSVPNATGDQGTLLTEDDYYRLDKLTVNVPVYDDMAPGHTVRVLWKGRRKDIIYKTPPQTVSVAAPMTFYVPRFEFIDNISDTVKVLFSVERSADNIVEFSGTLHLSIEGQSLDLPAPSLAYNYDDGSIQVIVSYSGMTTEQTIEVRLVGKTMVQTDLQTVDNLQNMVIDIPNDWAEENRGHLVLIDYAIGDINGDRYNFSHILRRVL